MPNLALVTGATSGLGKEFCSLLSEKKIPLFLTGRNPELLEEIACRFNAGFLPLDLTFDRSPLLTWIREHQPDLVVNCAGYAFYGPVLMHDWSSHQKLFEVNSLASIEITIEAARALQSHKKRGTILNISSIAGEMAIPLMASYAASKALLTSFSKSFDTEMKPFGIRTLASIPGPIATPFAERASFGRFIQRPSLMTLTAARAAQLIWRQIETQTPTRIIGLTTQALFFLTQLLPRRFVEWVLQKNLSNRYTLYP